MAHTSLSAESEYQYEAPLEDFIIDPEEGRRMFDEAAREWVGMSGEEFIRRWEAGEFETTPDDEAHRLYIELALMIPLARQ